MKYGVIDVGSNSVRLLISNDLLTEKKLIETTRLAEGLDYKKSLSKDSIIRTTNALIKFYNQAKKEGAEQVFVFATEALRSASNKEDFFSMLKKSKINVDIISGEEEGLIGFLGAYTDGICAVLDVGGASSELTIGDSSHIIYSESLKLGAVKLNKMFGENEKAIKECISQELDHTYKIVPKFDTLLMIGGTATSYTSIIKKMKVYNPYLVDKYIMRIKDLNIARRKVMNTPIDKRNNIVGLSENRKDIIVAGGILLETILEYLQISKAVVRESDNLEGYLKLKINTNETHKG